MWDRLRRSFANPRRLFVLVLVCAWAVTMWGMWALLSGSFLADYRRLEREDVLADLGRAEDALGARVAALRSSTRDWAVWDDPYRFVQDRNPEFIEVNVQDSPFRSLGLNLMVFVDTAPRVVFAKQFDLAADHAVPVDPVLIESLMALPELFRHDDPGHHVAGLLGTPAGLVVIGASPILPSDESGPVRGTLVFLRKLDAGEVARVAETVHLDIRVRDAAGAGDDAVAALRARVPVVREVDADRVEAFTPLLDVRGEPVAVLQLASPRAVYAQGVRTVRWAYGVVGVAAAITFSVVYVLVSGLWTRAEDQVRRRAFRDPLTGLPNRALFSERLAGMLAAERDGRPGVAVAFLDLDGFKDVNDTYGHDVADRLLVSVASRLEGGVRGNDFVARHGGDEFLVLAPGVHTPDGVRALAERLIGALAAPFVLDERELHLSASVGIAVSPEDGADAATLVKHADLAMYEAKEAGRGGWIRFDPSLDARAGRTLHLRGRLAGALAAGELRLEYQPQVDATTGRIVAVEALVRWHTPERVILPGEFVPVAEQTGLIAPIGAWILRRACADAMAWSAAGLPPIRVAVNVSTRQFRDEAIVGQVREALAATGLPASRLELEITESLAMREPELARRALELLKGEGLTVALDDFGAGYSSLANLRLYPFDRVKLDRAFLADGPTAAPLVSAVVRLAHALGFEVVAEGVETAEQLALLREEGADALQGYLISRPVPADGIAELLKAGAPTEGRREYARP
ncbi:MAG: putative bifunctional diguanylate cyclase/phosphodiesterase [Myxococcota bacterium]